MKKEEIVAKKGLPAIGPYSQAVKSGGFLFCSGHIGINPKTNQFAGNYIQSQTRQSFENLKEVLKAAGTNLDAILKMTVFLKNMDDFSAMNEIYATYFKKPYPARSTVEVARLPKGALIEIECIAKVKDMDCEDCDGCC